MARILSSCILEPLQTANYQLATCNSAHCFRLRNSFTPLSPPPPLPLAYCSDRKLLTKRVSELSFLSAVGPHHHRRFYAFNASSRRREEEVEEDGSVVAVKDEGGGGAGGEGTIAISELHKEATQAYMAYAMSVLLGCTLLDERDGLKPNHCRIL